MFETFVLFNNFLKRTSAEVKFGDEMKVTKGKGGLERRFWR